MKTMLFFVGKGCRKPKARGLATAKYSAMHIRDYRQLVIRSCGTFYLVDCTCAEQGRALIAQHKANKLPESVRTAAYDDSRTICIGESAITAIGGSERAVAQWDSRIRTQGRVFTHQSKAL